MSTPDPNNIKKFVQNDGTKADINNMTSILNEKSISDINIRDSSFNNGTALMFQT